MICGEPETFSITSHFTSCFKIYQQQFGPNHSFSEKLFKPLLKITPCQITFAAQHSRFEISAIICHGVEE